jgi:hypothetical protein
MKHRPWACVLTAIALGACGGEDPKMAGGGAGGNGGGGSGGQMAMAGDYFPFKPGNRWEYQVTDLQGFSHHKLNTVVGLEMVGGTGPNAGVMAYRTETLQQDPVSPDATISWQAVDGAKLVRYREESCKAGSLVMNGDLVASCRVNEEDYWAPFRERLDQMPDAHAWAVGLKWDETFMEWKTTYSYQVDPMNPTKTLAMATQTEKWEILQVGVTAKVPYGDIPNCVVVKKTASTGVPKSYTFCAGVGKAIEDGAGQTEKLTAYSLK